VTLTCRDSTLGAMRKPPPPAGLLLDLDGTVYEDDALIPGAAAAIAALREQGIERATVHPPSAAGTRRPDSGPYRQRPAGPAITRIPLSHRTLRHVVPWGNGRCLQWAPQSRIQRLRASSPNLRHP